jgi:hypothetical protein
MISSTTRRTLIVLLLVALACVPLSHASLTSMAFGFPTMTQFQNGVAFNTGSVNAFDFETADFQPFGSAGIGFPSIGQSSVQGQVVNQCEFSQNTVFAAYSYPSVDTGLGFAGFGDIPAFDGLF